MAVASAKIVLASGNAGKLREIGELLLPLKLSVVPQAALGVSPADETGTTFEENAIIKASHAVAMTDLPAIGDDSGLVVDALGGRPGVYSARFAGPGASDEQNIEKLLAELAPIGEADRTAAFHCVACFIDLRDGMPVLARGVWHGRILTERRGSGGFGYDPVFAEATSDRAAAELTPQEKNARSHRGQAFRRLARLLSQRDLC